MAKETPAQNNENSNETQYFNAPSIDKNVLKCRKEEKKQFKKMQKTSSSLLLFIFVKELIVLILTIIIATKWKSVGDAGGNFGITVGACFIYLPFAIIFDALTLDKYKKTTGQYKGATAVIALSVLLNFIILILLPQIMQIILP